MGHQWVQQHRELQQALSAQQAHYLQQQQLQNALGAFGGSRGAGAGGQEQRQVFDAQQGFGGLPRAPTGLGQPAMQGQQGGAAALHSQQMWHQPTQAPQGVAMSGGMEASNSQGAGEKVFPNESNDVLRQVFWLSIKFCSQNFEM